MLRNLILSLVAALMTAGILGVSAMTDDRDAQQLVETRRTGTSAFEAVYVKGLHRLDAALVSLDSALATADSVRARRAFRVARSAYKRIEIFADYYAPDVARQLNGVPLPKAEQEDPEHPLPAMGLQVAEAALFPRLAPDAVRDVRRQMPYLRAAVRQLERQGLDTMAGAEFAFDAMRHEIARLSTLGIAGFDASASGDAIPEAAASVRGVHDAIAPWRSALQARSPATYRRLEARFASAVADLERNPDFDGFARLSFITGQATPLAHALADAQRALEIGPPVRPRAWSTRAASIFDQGAIDPMFFAAADAVPPTAELVTLGRSLFFDPALSGNGRRSCATCHVPERAFTDGRARPQLLSVHGRIAVGRNTPTLINAALQPAIFADDRVRTLEDQATDVLGSASEMGGSLQIAADMLRRRGESARFARAFQASPDTALSPRTLRLAIAVYVRSLVAMHSPADRAMQGDTNALTADERRGFDLFMGKARCGTCHFAPLFNGATPPALSESEMEVIGVPARFPTRAATVDPDSGRFTVRRIDQHLHAFRTPSLRNVALTAPYMHNGAFRTLADVIAFYDGGGGHGLGVRLPNQTLPADSLHLTSSEKRELLTFLAALTDTVGTTARTASSARSGQ